jgi:proteasome regulatory subunit
MEAGMFAIRKEHDAVSRSDFLNAIEKIGLDFDRQKFASSFGAMFA